MYFVLNGTEQQLYYFENQKVGICASYYACNKKKLHLRPVQLTWLMKYKKIILNLSHFLFSVGEITHSQSLDWAKTDKLCQAGRQSGRQTGSPHFLVNTLET